MSVRPRLDPEIFRLPVAEIRAGFYSDKYFVRAREILLADRYRPRVTMQVFGKMHGFVAGIDEAIAILRPVRQRMGRADGARAV
jgi:nicotinate phosphoribosyltransferase